MGWKETYASKLTSMDEAAKVVKSGDTVIIAHAVGEPVALVDKMVDYAVAADLLTSRSISWWIWDMANTASLEWRNISM